MKIRGKNSPLAAGIEYVVLELMAHANWVSARVEVASHDGSPVLVPLDGTVEVVDARLSGRWRAELVNGALFLAPALWLRPGFWEQFFDGDPAAERDFRLERDLLVQEATGEPGDSD